MEMTFQSVVKTLHHLTSVSQEVACLHQLQYILAPNSSESHDPDIVEREWLEYASTSTFDDENPFPGKVITRLLPGQAELNSFTYYCFMRRYGWSEVTANGDLGYTGPLPSDVDKYKSSMNDILNDLIKWYLHQKMNVNLMKSMLHILSNAVNKPVVRNQTVIHIMDWYKANPDSFTHDIFLLVKETLIVSMTDVWSAIRNACVSRLSIVVEHFTSRQLQSFFNDLVDICQSSDSSWQAKEGAVMGITVIVKRFQWIGCLPGDSNSMEVSSPRTEYLLKFGKQELYKMPHFITSRIHSVIYPLLAHPQLSIREHSTKAFSSYLSRCDFKVLLEAFKDLILQLSPPVELLHLSTSEPAQQLPHLAVLNPEFKFMHAYAAEGLLGVCLYLVKHVPPGFLLPNWPVYFSTFSLYLMHPASTVRQATSSIFKYLVAKDSNNPTILKLVLHGLCSEWRVNNTLLVQPINTQLYIRNDQSHPRSHDVESDTVPSPRQRRSCPKGRRHSITKLTISGKAEEGNLPDTWEYREGRLFAYELILKFLIKNHLMYTFGIHHTGQHISQQSVGSKLASVSTSACSEETPSRPVLQKTQSYGGQTLKQILASIPKDSPTPTSSSNSIDNYSNYSDSPDFDSMPSESPRQEIDVRGVTQDVQDASSANISFNINPSIKRTGRSISTEQTTTPSLKTMIKHYSFYTKPSAPFRSPGSLYTAMPSSLLQYAKAIDNYNGSPMTSPPESPDSGFKTLNLSQNDSDVLRSCLCPSPLNGANTDNQGQTWLADVDMSSLSSLLQTVLYQAIECLADSRWELRRMGQQVLPCIVEVLRWYDMNTLEELWDSHLTPNTSLACYAACTTFRYSVSHAGKLKPLIRDPPTSWQDTEHCIQAARQIMDSVTVQLYKRTTCLETILLRDCFDRLSTVAMETIMLSQVYFPFLHSQTQSQLNTILDFLEKLFCHAHPESEVSKDIRNTQNIGRFHTAKDGGFLSYVHGKVENCDDIFYARQMEKTLLSEILHTLPSFISTSRGSDIIRLFPLCSYYIGFYADDEIVARGLMECVGILTATVTECMKSDQPADRAVFMKQLCLQTLREFSQIVMNKDIEPTVLRQILDIYRSLSVHVCWSDHLTNIFRAIATRVCNASDGATVAIVNANLSLLSNDVHLKTFNDAIVETDSDDEDNNLDKNSANGLLQESLILTTSGNSGGGTTGRISALSGSTDGRVLSAASNHSDVDSDWDSWSDNEQQDKSVLDSIFSEFLQKLNRLYESHIPNTSGTSFEKELGKIYSEKDQHVIRTLLDNSSL